MTPAGRAAREAECDALFAAEPTSDLPGFWRALQLRNELDDTDEGDDGR